jgi:hypothetical protein
VELSAASLPHTRCRKASIWLNRGNEAVLRGGVSTTTVNVPDPHLAMVDGDRLYACASLSDLQRLIL